MEEQTITEPVVTQPSGGTEVPVDASGRAIPEPEQTTEAAVSQTEESTASVDETPEVGDTGEETKVDNTVVKQDDDLTKWAANKGIEVSTEAERKLAEMARNAEKAMHTKAGEVSELQKSVKAQATQNSDEFDPVSQLQQEFQALKLETNVRNFYQDHPDAKAMDAELGALVEQRPHLAGDLEALYALAKLNQLNSQEKSLKDDGARKALETLATKQQANVPTGNATSGRVSSTPTITSANVDRLIAQNGHQWYLDNRDEINRVIEGR
jgi:hypothetical protein